MSTNKKIILPAHVEASIAVMYRGASEEKLAEVRAQCAEQIALNEQKAAQRNATGPNTGQTRGTAYIGGYVRYEDMGTGVSSNRSNILGIADNNFARFYTPTAYPFGQAAIVGTATFHVPAGSEVYIVAKKGPTDSIQTNKNRISVWISKNGADWTWQYIGNAVITTANNTTAGTYYVGSTPIQGIYITVECNIFSGTNGGTVFNDVEADCVLFYY